VEITDYLLVYLLV